MLLIAVLALWQPAALRVLPDYLISPLDIAKHLFAALASPVLGRDEICPCLQVRNTYDGSARIAVHIGAFRFVCTNLAVGGAFRKRQIKRLRQRGITAVVDCRLEAKDDADALKHAGIEFLHLPTPDRYGFTYGQMQEGVEWVLEHVSKGGRAFLHCEHGVGRGPLMLCAVLVAQGYGAPEALRMVRRARWQALPNDRQLAALLDFEQNWRRTQSDRAVDDTATLNNHANVVRVAQAADIGRDVSAT